MVNIFVKNSTNDTFMMERFNPYSIIPRLTKHHLSSGSNTFSSLKYGFYFTSSCNVSDISSISFDGYDTSNIVDMSLMFYHLPLAKLDLNNFDTRNVRIFYGMFCGCRNISELDLSSFDTSKVEDMFDGCCSLKKLDLSKFDTSNVLSMTRLFCGCRNLKELDLSNFDMGNVKYMTLMFYGCDCLRHIRCKKAFRKWCMIHMDTICLPLSMCEGGEGVWDIVD